MTTALVTGSAKRVGKEIALYLAEKGFNIALHCNTSKKDAEETSKEIREKKVTCKIFQCELQNEKKLLQLIPEVKKKFPDLALLFNCASIYEPSQMKDGNSELLDRQFAVNFKAPYLLSGSFAQHCKKGLIINMIDSNFIKNVTTNSAYLLSKKAVAEMTTMAALEFAPDIRVNGIAPGLTMLSAKETEEHMKKWIQSIPLKIRPELSYLFKTIQFFIDNPYITGQIIFVDGGAHLK